MMNPKQWVARAALLSFLVSLVLLGWTPQASAFDRYNSGCQDCHGAFTGSTSPGKGSVFPSNSKHEMHRAAGSMDTNCDLCHTGGDNRNPFIGSSDGTNNNVGVGCTGCHGREEDAGNDLISLGRGAGLRQHHTNSGIVTCTGCHDDAFPSNYTPVGEDVKPQYYGTVDTNANISCNPDANSNTNENWTIGDFEGLDNDGDTLYDAVADPDCMVTNTPPDVTNPGAQTDDENQPVNLPITASDVDPDDMLSYSAMGLPPNLTINVDTGVISGTVSFDAVLHPNLSQNFNVTVDVSDGTDTTSASFTWTVNDVNRAPVAADDSDTTLQDQPVTVDVQANDSDADGDALTTANVTAPANGTATINAGDTVTYTPNTGFVGADSFDYTIQDGFGGAATATVTVNVTAVNDPPNVTNPGTQANDENQSVSLQVTASDPDGDVLIYSAINLPPDLTIDSSTGLITGTVSFDAVVHPAIQDVYAVTVDVTDGLTTTSVNFDWTITDVNRAPVAVDDNASTVHDSAVTVDVLANDSDADGDTLTVAGVSAPANGTVAVNVNNTVSYTPDAGFVGTDNFTYTIDDGFGGSATATVNVDVTNQAPVALDDVFATTQNTPLIVAAPGVLANDSDADGDPLTTVPAVGTTNGTLVLNADGSFTYTPNSGFIGQDSFTYFANDGIVDSNEATVSINVTEVNLPPVVENPGPQANDENDGVSLQIVASDPNGDTLGYTATGLPPGLSIGASSGLISGTVSFDAVNHPDLSAVYPVTVTVSDGANPVETVNFDWTVIDVNRAPTAVDDAANTQVDTPMTVDVLANDSDPDGDTLTIAAVTVPPNGAAAINPDGTVSYTPNTGFTGTDAFDYTIEDGFGGSATATVTMTVVAGPPVDLDIAQFKVTKNIRMAKVKPIAIQLTVKNDGTVEGDAPATIVGVQNNVEVYNETLTVSDAVGNGRTKWDFPSYTPAVAGTIVWTATIADGDPDADEAAATTTVR